MKAMVLAAGRGERLRPMTDMTPKPLVPVGGKPLISHHLEALARAGIRDVVINLSWLADRVRTALGDGRHFGVHITYSDEGATALETGGGIFNALQLLGSEPFLVVNGDIWTDIDFAALASRIETAADWRTNLSVLAHLVLVPNPPQHPGGDFGLDGDRVLERESGRFTYSGVGLYRPELFAGCTPGRFPLAPLLKRAIAAGRLRGELHHGDWCDAGTPERLAALDERVRARQA
ncbi:MAG: N-acetylmuramate alpha-1-phosphate uridylyltransferase MurU [Steroidobacteraceae bacterium]